MKVVVCFVKQEPRKILGKGRMFDASIEFGIGALLGRGELWQKKKSKCQSEESLGVDGHMFEACANGVVTPKVFQEFCSGT